MASMFVLLKIQESLLKKKLKDSRGRWQWKKRWRNVFILIETIYWNNICLPK